MRRFVFACAAVVGLSSTATAQRIREVRIQGVRRVDPGAVRAEIITHADTLLDPAATRVDVRALWATGWFADVRVLLDDDVVIFQVHERPLVRKVTVAGNSALDLEAINEVLDLKRDVLLDRPTVNRNRRAIADLYRNKGFYLSQVESRVVPVREGEVDIAFDVDEAGKVEIRRVEFSGNQQLTDSELRRVVRTEPGGALSLLTDSGTFDQAKLEQDLLMLTAYYYDRGFLRVQIGAPRVELSRARTSMYITIPIDEGPIFQVGATEVTGDLIGTPAEHRSLLRLTTGDRFSRSAFSQDLLTLTNRYRDQGYAFAEATPHTELDLAGDTVSLSYELTRGPKVYIERIAVRGHNKSRDKVLRRELSIAEGDLYDQSAIDRSRARLMALGYFSAVNISSKRGSAPDFMVLNIEVQERSSDTFQIGLGFSSRDAFIAQSQLQFSNFLGNGQALTFTGQLSSSQRLFLFRFSEPYFLDSKWAFAFDVYNQKRPLGELSRHASGGSLSWGRRLGYRTSAHLTYRLEQASLDGTQGYGPPIANLYRGGRTGSLRLSLRYDSRNNRLFPTAGSHASVFAEVADETLGSETELIRVGAAANHYHPLWGPFVLKLNAEAGYVASWNELGVPLTERYLLGGIQSIRGFSAGSLGPRITANSLLNPGEQLQDRLLGGNLSLVGNVELEFPLFKEIGISGVLFLDVGNTYNLESRYCSGADTNQKFDPCFSLPGSLTSGLRSSVGAGFRWLSPIGLLRFEWGFPLDRQEGERSRVFEFSVGGMF